MEPEEDVPGDYASDDPDVPDSVVGRWIDENLRAEAGDNLLWDDSLEFREDGTGYVAQSGGALNFEYTLADDGTIFIWITDGEDDHETMCRVSGNTITVIDSDLIDEGKEFVYQGS